MDTPHLKEQQQLCIDGKWRDASDGGVFESRCPADGRLLAACAQATRDDVDKAVRAAWKAWEAWKKTSFAERADILNAIADAIDMDRERLALIECFDTGKPIREARDDMDSAARHFRYFAGVISADQGTATMLDDDTMIVNLREPIGVAGQIVPWNFPLSMASWKLAPALAAGCCVVFKPAMETSLSILELTELLMDVTPPGVVNIVTGSGSKAGSYILDHPDIAKLAFTGSTEVGYEAAAAAARKLVPATLELGGKSANIIFPDCNRELAFEGVMQGILLNQGQSCTAGSRVFVHADIYDSFLAESVRRFDRVKVGMPWEEETQMGAVINEKQAKRVLDYVDVGRKEGARLACGGVRLKDDGFDRGSFVAPTILAEVKNTMRVAREEIFGPVACFLRFRDVEEVIALANDSEYGLGGSVYTQDINRAIRIARAVRAGRIWINTSNETPEAAPFGGCKKSGIGRETHAMAVDAYSQVKSVIINLKTKPAGLYS